MQTIDFWASTHQGLTRTHNEDRYLWLTPEDTGGNGHLWVVCDGMGGEAGGARASQIVLERFREVYAPSLERTSSPHEALKETLNAANRRLLYLASEDSLLAGMGSTVAAVALYRDRLWVASVGDSRVYGWTPNGLLQWTVDHSKYEKMRELGVLSPDDERPDHPARHVLMNVVGRDEMFVDTLNDRHFVTEDCALLICSDGLSGSVRPEELRVAFASLDARDATRFLMSAALPRSQDNITLQVVRFTPPITPRAIEDVATSFGIKLIEPGADPHLDESGQSIQDSGRASGASNTPAPVERRTSPSASMPITTKHGDTVLLSPDALSNVFGDASSAPSDTADEVSKRVTAAGGTMMLSPDELSKAMEEQGITNRKRTMMLSPDALSKAMEEQGIMAPKSTTPVAGEPSASKGETPEVDKVSSAPIGVLDDPSEHRATKGEGGGPSSTQMGEDARAEARRRLAARSASDDVLPEAEEPVVKRRTVFILIAVCLLLLLIAGILLWKLEASDSSSTQDSEGLQDIEQTSAQKDSADSFAPRTLPTYALAKQRSTPDVVHEIDDMPAYAVLGESLVIDAHEATVGQFARVRDALRNAGGDDAPLQTIQCLGQDDEYTQDVGRQPACVTPLAAAAYCDAVGRRLPRADEWNAIVETEQARIARGHGKLFTRAADGPPPSVPEHVDAILGVYDGLPEFLYANKAQVRHGDLVLLAPSDERVTRGEPRGMERYESKSTPADQMLGVRCISEKTDDVMDSPREPVKESSSRRESVPAQDVPAPPQEPAVGRVAPRVDAPDEAPIDPDIPDRSRILEYMKEK